VAYGRHGHHDPNTRRYPMKFAVSLVATDATDAEGRPLVRGETIELSPEQRDDPFNQRLIADRQLISVSSSDKTQAEAQEALGKQSQPERDPVPSNPNTEGGAES
jgi:hypothetical protein